MLFRPPDVGLFPAERIGFALLVFVLLLRTFMQHSEIQRVRSVTWPMVGLLVLALVGTLKQPYDSEAWSLLAAKFLVPFFMFHIAALVFRDTRSVRQFEIFCVAVLVYLCFISIAFLLGKSALIFPRFILDASLGAHPGRARGPFLQAVANGVSLNLLGLFAVDMFRRGRITSALSTVLCLALPTAVFATMTRAVWLSFVLSGFAALMLGRSRRRIWGLMAAGATLVVFATLASNQLKTAFEERLEERSPIEFRTAVYELTWEMIKEKPLFGWGPHQLSPEIEARISEFHPNGYAAHNTFMEILVEHGVIGLALYGWMAVGLFRLGTRRQNAGDQGHHSLWAILLGVYFFNACFVVMNYQFVNALVFTFAGLLAAQECCPRSSAPRLCRRTPSTP